MLALIKREIEDHWLLFVLGAIVTSLLTFTVIWNTVFGQHRPPLGIPSVITTAFIVWQSLLLLLFSAILGASQMFSDLNQKKCSFLATLATTRRRILSAKIIAGLLFIVMFLSPALIADIVLLSVFRGFAPLDIIFPVKIVITAILASLCCYTLGLQMGWQTNKRSAILGSIIVTPLLLSVIIIKGFCVQTAVILGLFVITMFIRTWQKFMSTSL